MVEGDHSYASKVRPEARICYSSLIDGGRVGLNVASRHQEVTLRQSLIWLDAEYALIAVPIVFATKSATLTWCSTVLAKAAGVEDVLRIQKQLTDESTAAGIYGELTDSLAAAGIVAKEAVFESSFLADDMAIQLWDLDGSLVAPGKPRPSQSFDGFRESRYYSWELSALMAYPVDHVIDDHLWRQRSPVQVFEEVSEGYTMLGDHMVFVNHCCCLEISHLPYKLKERSRFRLREYGYDSSATFVWSLANLRAFVLRNLMTRYQQQTANLLNTDGLHAAAMATLAKAALRHQSLLDLLAAFPQLLRESRLREIDERVLRLRYPRDPIGPLRRNIERSQSLAADLVKARNQSLQERNNSLIAILTASLATVGIPALVDQFTKWISAHDYANIIISGAGIVIVLAVLVTFARRRR